MNTLLCLLSDQRMQNVIPLLQRGLHFDRVVLLASLEHGRISSHYGRIASEMTSALQGLAKWELHPFPVDPMVPEASRIACLEVIRRSGGPEHVTINFTGGTKPMSIGAYQAGLDCKAKLLYIDTQAEQIYTYNDDATGSISFDLQPISVETMLAAHGKIINRRGTNKLALSQNEMRLTELIYTYRPASLSAIPQIRKQFDPSQNAKNQKWPTSLDLWLTIPGFLQACKEIGFVDISGKTVFINHPSVHYFNGRWLEGYVFLALQKSGFFMDAASQVKLIGVENELDAVCTINAKLGVVECKSGSLKGAEGQAAINRLRALRDSLGGTFAKSFLVTPYPADSLSGQFIQRAKEYVSCMINQEELTQVEDVIKDEMCRKRQ